MNWPINSINGYKLNFGVIPWMRFKRCRSHPDVPMLLITANEMCLALISSSVYNFPSSGS